MQPSSAAPCVLEELGPTFVKLGQVASTRPDVVPPEVVLELRKLQDAVPAVAFTAIREQLERSFGSLVSDLSESIDEHPLAAGSIAQVHRARLRTNEGSQEVVIKVQRPGVAEIMASDLSILHTFASLMEHPGRRRPSCEPPLGWPALERARHVGRMASVRGA